jgi:hypothetical protein
MRYGSRDEIEFTQEEWPNAPTIKHEKFDAATLLRLLAAAAALFQEEQPAK